MFESGERVITDVTYSRSGDFDLVVPADAAIGEHVMRIRSNWQESSADPCDAFDYGETEDYKVIIAASDTVQTIDALDFEVINAGNNLLIRAEDVLAKDMNVDIYNGIGQKLYSYSNPVGQKLNLEIPIAGYAGGVYYVRVSNGKTKKVKQFLVY